MKRSGSGFTIVELLIVIVVIAILAAITIVAYNGITQQAKDSELLARVDAYTKILKLYKAQNGSFPAINAGESGSANNACLGNASEYPASAPFASGACDTLGTKTSSSLVTALQNVTNPLPKGSIDISSDGTYSYRGLDYFTPGGSTSAIQLQYTMQGTGRKCGRGIAINSSGTTICIVNVD